MREDDRKRSVELCVGGGGAFEKRLAWISLNNVVQSDCNTMSLLIKHTKQKCTLEETNPFSVSLVFYTPLNCSYVSVGS